MPGLEPSTVSITMNWAPTLVGPSLVKSLSVTPPTLIWVWLISRSRRVKARQGGFSDARGETVSAPHAARRLAARTTANRWTSRISAAWREIDAASRARQMKLRPQRRIGGDRRAPLRPTHRGRRGGLGDAPPRSVASGDEVVAALGQSVLDEMLRRRRRCWCRTPPADPHSWRGTASRRTCRARALRPARTPRSAVGRPRRWRRRPGSGRHRTRCTAGH